MRFFAKMKDGGPDSTSTGYWLVEIKGLFSILLLKFDGKSREAFHTHAFHAVSWLCRGLLYEKYLDGRRGRLHWPSIKPIITKRSDFHMVHSIGTSWALSFRGPWQDEWYEHIPDKDEDIILTHGRVITGESNDNFG